MNHAEIKALIEAHTNGARNERSDWDMYHAWYLSEFWDEDGRRVETRDYRTASGRKKGSKAAKKRDLTMESNYVFAFVDSMIANVCPTNPMLTISAKSSRLGQVAAARERLVNDTFRQDRMHASSWDMATYAAICGRAISKTTWSVAKQRPITRVINPRNVFYDHHSEWDDMAYVFEAVPMRVSTFRKRVESGEYDAEAAESVSTDHNHAIPDWLVSRRSGKDRLVTDAAIDQFGWVVVYEVYDLEAGTYMVTLPDAKKPLVFSERLPYMFQRNPYALLVFNRSLRDHLGVSDVKLIEKLQFRLNELDTLELLHAHASIPITLFDESAVLSPEEAVEAIRKCTEPGAVARIKMAQDKFLRDAFVWSQAPGMNPSFDKMRARATELIEFILGLPQYSRGVVGKSDIATELALADSATRTRGGRRIKAIEDWVLRCGQQQLALWKEFLTDEMELIVRDRATSESVPIDRSTLGFGELLMTPEGLATIDGQPIDDVLVQHEFEAYYDFEAVPYSPTENSKSVQLQKLAQFMPFLLQSGADPRLLLSRLADLLAMPELREAAAQLPAGPPGAQGIQPEQLPGGGTPDSLAGGGMPDGMAQDAIIPPEAGQLASQPKLEL